MSLKVVSFSVTPLAGAPIRNARAIARHSDIETRHVDVERWGRFEHDHVHIEAPEETVALAEAADIIHLYNYLDYDSGEFAPVDFRELVRRGKCFVRHFESTPQVVAGHMGIEVKDVLQCPIPKLVIPHYPERFFPTARIVPNIFCDDPPQGHDDGEACDIIFTPSWMRSAWGWRWDTKGMPETVAMLSRVRERTGCRTKCVQGVPHNEALWAKRNSSIVIDELITGSYHLSALEGIWLEKATLAYLDDRTKAVLASLTGTADSPFISARLEDAEEVLVYLADHLEEAEQIGAEGGRWFRTHWSAEKMVRHFTEAYDQLLADPTKVCRQPELHCDTPLTRFFAVTLPDAVYQARSDAWQRDIEQRRQISQREAEVKRLSNAWLPGPIIRLGRKVWARMPMALRGTLAWSARLLPGRLVGVFRTALAIR